MRLAFCITNDAAVAYAVIDHHRYVLPVLQIEHKSGCGRLSWFLKLIEFGRKLKIKEKPLAQIGFSRHKIHNFYVSYKMRIVRAWFKCMITNSINDLRHQPLLHTVGGGSAPCGAAKGAEPGTSPLEKNFFHLQKHITLSFGPHTNTKPTWTSSANLLILIWWQILPKDHSTTKC